MIKRQGDRLLVQGCLTIETVPKLFQTGLAHLATEDLLVDFSAVEAVDSAAVSLLLGWTRAARNAKRDLRVVNLPDNLQSLARLYGVDALLPRAA